MKGFGFVEGEDGKEYFVHMTGLNEGVTIREADNVTFDVEQGDRGPKAGNVSLDSGDSAPAEEASEDEATEDSEEEATEEEAEVEEEADEESEAEEEAPAEEEAESEDKKEE